MAPRNSFSVNPSRKEIREMRDLTGALREERRKVAELERENEEKKKKISWLQTELAEWKSKYIHSVSSNGELVVVCGKYDEERKIFEKKYKEAKEELERMKEERSFVLSPKEENQKKMESLLISLGTDVKILAELLRNASEKMISVQETILEINEDKQHESEESKLAVSFCAVLFLGKLKAKAMKRKMDEAEEKSALLRKKFSNLLMAGLFVTKLKKNWERKKIEREKERMTIEMRGEHRRQMALEEPEETEEEEKRKEKAARIIRHFLRRFVEKKRTEEWRQKRELCAMKYKRRVAEKKKKEEEKDSSLKKEEEKNGKKILKEELQKLIHEYMNKKIEEKEFVEKKREIYEQIMNLFGSQKKTLSQE